MADRALEPLSFVFARLLDPLAAALEARRSRRGRAAPATAAHRSDDAFADAAAAGADARSAGAAHAAAARSRIPSAVGRHRHRHDRSRSGAGAIVQYSLLERAGAVAGNTGDADGAPRRAGRRDALRLAAAPRYPSARRLDDGAGRRSTTASRFGSTDGSPRDRASGLARRSRSAGAAPRSGRRSPSRAVERGRPAAWHRSPRHAGRRRPRRPARGDRRAAGGIAALESRRVGRRARRRRGLPAVPGRDTGQWFAEGVYD